jgi:hypothetical protein
VVRRPGECIQNMDCPRRIQKADPAYNVPLTPSRHVGDSTVPVGKDILLTGRGLEGVEICENFFVGAIVFSFNVSKFRLKLLRDLEARDRCRTHLDVHRGAITQQTSFCNSELLVLGFKAEAWSQYILIDPWHLDRRPDTECWRQFSARIRKHRTGLGRPMIILVRHRSMSESA